MTATDKKKGLNKTELKKLLVEKTGLEGKQVDSVLNELSNAMIADLKVNGEFTLPGLLKVRVVNKPAVAGGKEVKNPFTGLMMTTKDKPAKNVIKVNPLKKLKESV